MMMGRWRRSGGLAAVGSDGCSCGRGRVAGSAMRTGRTGQRTGGPGARRGGRDRGRGGRGGRGGGGGGRRRRGPQRRAVGLSWPRRWRRRLSGGVPSEQALEPASELDEGVARVLWRGRAVRHGPAPQDAAGVEARQLGAAAPAMEGHGLSGSPRQAGSGASHRDSGAGRSRCLRHRWPSKAAAEG